MYYEEKFEDGFWWWRGTPNGNWEKFSEAKLYHKLAESRRLAIEECARVCEENIRTALAVGESVSGLEIIAAAIRSLLKEVK